MKEFLQYMIVALAIIMLCVVCRIFGVEVDE